jgi:hypothetical protein
MLSKKHNGAGLRTDVHTLYHLGQSNFGNQNEM